MSNHQQIVTLAKDRIRPMEIAQRLKLHPNTVYDAISKARRRGEDIPRFSKGKVPQVLPPDAPSLRHIAVPVRLFSLLEKQAERKGVTPTEAAQRLLEDALLMGVNHD